VRSKRIEDTIVLLRIFQRLKDQSFESWLSVGRGKSSSGLEKLLHVEGHSAREELTNPVSFVLFEHLLNRIFEFDKFGVLERFPIVSLLLT
jgi:hypothetical protein